MIIKNFSFDTKDNNLEVAVVGNGHINKKERNEINKFKFVFRFNEVHNNDENDKVSHIIARKECKGNNRITLKKIINQNVKYIILDVDKLGDKHYIIDDDIIKKYSLPNVKIIKFNNNNNFEEIWKMFSIHFNNNNILTKKFFKNNHIFGDDENYCNDGPSLQ